MNTADDQHRVGDSNCQCNTGCNFPFPRNRALSDGSHSHLVRPLPYDEDVAGILICSLDLDLFVRLFVAIMTSASLKLHHSSILRSPVARASLAR